MVLAPFVGSTAGTEQALVLLLIVAAAVAVLARRVGVPYIIGLVLVGLVVGLSLHWDTLKLSSDLVFYVFLPILLFESAYNLEAALLRDQWRRIAALAVPGVLVAFGLTAVGVHLLGGLAWGVALLFGALIAATDPVSVVSIFRKLGVSERLTTLVDAESLFNDGAAAVLFAVVLAVVVEGRDFSAGWAVGTFLWMSVGGTAVGLAVGFGASWIHRRLDDHLIEITLSTIVAYGSFLLAQTLGMSGVVACVTAAIVLGNLGRTRTMSPVTRVTLTTVWDYAAFVANSLIFLLIGLSVDLEVILDQVGLVLIAFAVVVAARAVTVYGLGGLARLFHRGPAPHVAARARLGRAAGDDRARAGAQCAGGRHRALRARDLDLRRRPAVLARAGADDAVAHPPPGARGRGAARERARARGAARRLRPRPRGARCGSRRPESSGTCSAGTSNASSTPARPASSRGCRRSRTSRSAGKTTTSSSGSGSWWRSAGVSTRCATAAP